MIKIRVAEGRMWKWTGMRYVHVQPDEKDILESIGAYIPEGDYELLERVENGRTIKYYERDEYGKQKQTNPPVLAKMASFFGFGPKANKSTIV